MLDQPGYPGLECILPLIQSGRLMYLGEPIYKRGVKSSYSISYGLNDNQTVCPEENFINMVIQI